MRWFYVLLILVALAGIYAILATVKYETSVCPACGSVWRVQLRPGLREEVTHYESVRAWVAAYWACPAITPVAKSHGS
jgi:hypothetical protein